MGLGWVRRVCDQVVVGDAAFIPAGWWEEDLDVCPWLPQSWGLLAQHLWTTLRGAVGMHFPFNHRQDECMGRRDTHALA